MIYGYWHGRIYQSILGESWNFLVKLNLEDVLHFISETCSLYKICISFFDIQLIAVAYKFLYYY